MTRPVRPALAVTAAALAVAGCLPIPRTVTLSPAIEGRYTTADGAPVAGAHVAVSAENGDFTCARADVRAVTDAQGRFAVPRTERRESFILIIPFDRLFEYQLCAGREPTFLAPAYEGAALHRVPATESLVCVETTVSPGRVEVACDTRSERTI